MPFLAKILLYPVKSFDAWEVSQATLLPSGALEFDRRFALVDAEGVFVNAKRTHLMHALRTGYEMGQRRLSIAHAGEVHAFHLDEDRTALENWLSQYFEIPLKLVENPSAGFPDDTEAPGPTIISTATLEAVAGWFPGLSVDEVRRRFRANLEIGGVEPFWEDRLYAEAGQLVQFRVGQAMLSGTNPCQRCIVPTRDSLNGAVWWGFSKIFAKERETNLPSWAERSRFNHFYRLSVNTRPTEHCGEIRVGDEVALVEA